MSTSNRVAQSLSQGDIKLEVDESIKPTHNENGQKLIYCSDGVITEDEIMAEESHIDEFEWLDVMTLQGKPEEMSWAKWIMYKTGRGVGHTLAYLESWGEVIAKEFGITEPIHQDILDLRDQIMEDAGEPITGFPEPRSEPVQFEPPRFETIFEADDAKKMIRARKKGAQRKNVRNVTVKFASTFNNLVVKVMRKRNGWVDGRDEEERCVDIFWVDTLWMHERFDTIYFDQHVRVNHFPRFYELTRKNLLAKNLKRYVKMKKSSKSTDPELREKIAEVMSFFPTTYDLPDQWHMFVEEFKKEREKRDGGKFSKPIWIMKPISKSEGKGIFLFKDLKDIHDWKHNGKNRKGDTEEAESYIVQRYIEKPLLIGGRKFDMRIYVLVTSYVPLRAYVYREGFARLSGTRYSTDHIEDRFVHLTNTAIQKKAPDYNPDRGAKWPLINLRRYLTCSRGLQETNAAFRRVNEVFYYSLQAVQDKVINDKHCFELYGYDVLFDSELRAWLIEVNASPSFNTSSDEDRDMKMNVLEDTFNVIDMEKRLSGEEKRVGGFDLITGDSESFLGCDNSDRSVQLREIYREAQQKI